MNPIKPTEILEPQTRWSSRRSWVRAYPAPEDGCLHTGPAAIDARKVTPPTRTRRPPHLFGASVLLTIAGQGVLAAVIATRTIPALVGATASIGLLVCGLLMIAAETLRAVER